MARVSDADLLGRVAGKVAEPRTEEPTAVPAPKSREPEPAKPRRQSSREGMTFLGFYINEETREQLRTMAYEQRREKQDLVREALDLLFKKHGYATVARKSAKSKS